MCSIAGYPGLTYISEYCNDESTSIKKPLAYENHSIEPFTVSRSAEKDRSFKLLQIKIVNEFESFCLFSEGQLIERPPNEEGIMPIDTLKDLNFWNS